MNELKYMGEPLKTKKNRDSKNSKDKKMLWEQFDKEINKDDSKKMECVYNNLGNRDKCDLCGEKIYLGEEGFSLCANPKCGIIYTDSLDMGAEWRYYGAEDNNSRDPTRCGMPINPLLEQSSYGCKVLCLGTSSYEMRKIKRYTEWQSMPYREKSQYDEFQRITIMAQNAGISKCIIDEALKYHKKISEQKTYRGLNRDGIIAASIYIACRIQGYGRTAKEIANIFNLDTTSATKGCKNAMSIINTLDAEKSDEDKTKYKNTKPIAFIDRYCSKLNINSELTKLCSFIAIKIDRNGYIPENTPHSVAAGIIYFIVQEFELNLTKRSIHNISEISEVTINKCYKKLLKLKDELIPSAIKKKYLNIN